jgi:hypothetical protein
LTDSPQGLLLEHPIIFIPTSTSTLHVQRSSFETIEELLLWT